MIFKIQVVAIDEEGREEVREISSLMRTDLKPATLAQRLEDQMGEEQPCFIEGCQRDWDRLPTPDGPLTVGMDGGYVRGREKKPLCLP